MAMPFQSVSRRHIIINAGLFAGDCLLPYQTFCTNSDHNILDITRFTGRLTFFEGPEDPAGRPL